MVPINAMMLSSTWVTHRPMATAEAAASGISRMAKAMRKLS